MPQGRVSKRGNFWHTSAVDASPPADRPAAPGIQFRTGWWPWAAAAVLTIGNLFLHLPISAVCDALFARIGRGPYEWVSLIGIGALCAGAALALLRHRWWALRRPHAASAVLALAVCTVAAQRWLLVTNVELIHFPQYALLAALLLAAGLAAQTAWIAATLAGVVDETYQFLVLYAGVRGTYFDYNDIVLNAVGAAWAVVLASAVGLARAERLERAWQRALLAALLAGLAVSLWLAPPRVAATDRFPYWQPAVARAATGLDYHVMPASEGLAAVLLLWTIVALVSPNRARSSRSAGVSVAVVLCIAVTVNACARSAHPPAQKNSYGVDDFAARNSYEHAPAAGPLPGPPRWPEMAAGEDTFIITFWCGPPLAEFTDERAAEIAAAGFNVVGAPCEGALTARLNRRALDIAARHGLTLWIADPRLGQGADLRADWEALAIEALADYGDHPALGGYFLVDEPSAAKFDDLGKVVTRLRGGDPRRVPYINLLPDFIPPEYLGTDTYREYVEQFVATVAPPLLSYDYYPFKLDEDRASFFDNLLLVREVAQARGIPFLLIVQVMPHGRYRDPTAAEIAWQVNHAVAFGARGISYFAYWTPVRVPQPESSRFRHGLIEHGQPTEHFEQVARINRDLRACAEQLEGFVSVAVADSDGAFGTPLPIGPLIGIDGGPVTAGFFSRGSARLLMLVNRDYERTRYIELTLRPGSPLPASFDVSTGHWHELRKPALVLAAGGARLLRWT